MATKSSNTVSIGNFSKYASSYDEYSSVQNETAGMLARMLPRQDVAKILEIGCGTGNYTALLRGAFKGAEIKAIDASGSMIEVAAQKLGSADIRFEIADAEACEMGEEYDLVTSNAVFHWFGDIENVIKNARLALKADGALIFSSFGPMTFLELKCSLSDVTGENVPISPDLFPANPAIEEILNRHFSEVRVTEHLLTETHPHLKDLLTKIKYSGTRGSGSDVRKTWSPDLLNKIEASYLERFGSITATYQAFFCEARI